MKHARQNLSFNWAIRVLVLLLSTAGARAADFHVATAQELQNALTTAAGNGADNTIYLTNGYYTGNFNYNSAGGGSLTIQAEPGVTNTAMTLDGAGTGRDLTLSKAGPGNFTVRGITFLRNCGSSGVGALRVSATAGAILVDSCRFLTPGSGMGIEVVSGTSFTVTNCIVSGGGGIGVSVSGVTGNVYVRNCVVATNYSNVEAKGGGVSVLGAQGFHVVGSSFLGNTSANAFGGGGGLYSQATPTVTISNSSFSGNSGNGGGGAGFNSASVTLIGNTFTSNSAVRGGGVDFAGNNYAIVSGNTFRGNHSSSDGGAGYFNSYAVVIGNSFVGNSTGTATGGGGAISWNPSAGVIASNNFTGNYCFYRGGGLKAVLADGGTLSLVGNTFRSNVNFYGLGGGVDCVQGVSATLTLSNNTFIANTATSSFADYAGGGGAYCIARNLILSGNMFRQNVSGYAGGFVASGNSVVLVNNLVARNAATRPDPYGGGGISVSASSNLFMINNTIFGNTSGGRGGGVVFYVGGTTEMLDVYNNIIWGNSAASDGADVWLAGTGQRKTFRFNNVHGMYGVWDIAENLLDVDPQFFDPVNGDYHIQSTSPCKEAGTNGAPSLPDLDLDAGPRIAGGTVDLGCYEFSTTATHPADVNGNFALTAAEFADYAAAWKTGLLWNNAPAIIPADYVTRAGYLMTNGGGAYTNDGSARPVNWKRRP